MIPTFFSSNAVGVNYSFKNTLNNLKSLFNKTIFAVTALSFLSATIASAQIMKVPPFGKISMEELTATQCPIDTGAQAYYIFDKGQTEFVYLNTIIRDNEAGSNKGFQMKYERHLRVKILDKAASSDLADFEIPLFVRGQNKEQITQIKGFTYNLVNGKIEKTKLDSKQIITDKKDDNWVVVKFAMPDVREGTVFEVSYQILSDFFFNLQEWHFQRMYPVLYSEYQVGIPQYFIYNVDMLGYLRVGQEQSSAARTITLTFKEQDNAGGFRAGGGSVSYTHKEDYRENITKYYVNNVPAFKVESFLRTPRNYLSKISFELTGTQFPRSAYKNFSSNWNEVSKELLKSENFGEVLTRGGFLKEEAEAIKSKSSAPIDQVVMAFERVKQKMNWNGNNRLYASVSNLKQTWDKGSGNSADINLTLVSLLNALGIESYPVALSTRANGIIPVSHPSISGFNYVIAMAVVDGKRLLMDATDPFAGVNMLPERCLNDNGRIIDNSKSDWVKLDGSGSSYQMVYANLALNSEGSFSGNIDLSESGYAAWDRRSQFKMHNNEDAFIENMEKELGGCDITEFSMLGMDSIYTNLKSSFKIALDNKTDQVGDMVVFNPLLGFSHKSNPFKLEKREYPVEFPYPLRRRVIMSYTLPEGFAVESLPAPQRLVSEDKSFQFTYSISNLGNTIQVVHDFSINKTMFLPDEYDMLKTLYASILNKHNEKIVLKRTAN